MIDQPNRLGWDAIWRGSIPNRFKSKAAPNSTLVEWARELTPGGLMLDIGCGVGRHCVYLGKLGFRMAGLDISPSGVAQTAEACAARGIPFDGRVSDMTVLDWPEVHRAIEEIYRYPLTQAATDLINSQLRTDISDEIVAHTN